MDVMLRYWLGVCMAVLMGCADTTDRGTLTLEFGIDEDACLDDLQVNLILQTQDIASYHYYYYKYLTVIDQGQVVIPKTMDRQIVRYTIEAYAPACHLSYDASGDHLQAYSSQGTYEYIHFGKTHITGRWQDGDDQYHYETEYRKDTSNTTALPRYATNPNSHTIKPLGIADLMHLIEFYSFEELMQGDKLLDSDIERLTHLSNEQKQQLTKANANKQFRPPSQSNTN